MYRYLDEVVNPTLIVQNLTVVIFVGLNSFFLTTSSMISGVGKDCLTFPMNHSNAADGTELASVSWMLPVSLVTSPWANRWRSCSAPLQKLIPQKEHASDVPLLTISTASLALQQRSVSIFFKWYYLSYPHWYDASIERRLEFLEQSEFK